MYPFYLTELAEWLVLPLRIREGQVQISVLRLAIVDFLSSSKQISGQYKAATATYHITSNCSLIICRLALYSLDCRR
jgi:hypothetical protein